MRDADQETALIQSLRAAQAGRRCLAAEGASWGKLILPASWEGEGREAGGLRLLLFASMASGLHAVRTLVAFERRFPAALELVGLVTDDAVSPGARISLAKRTWKYVDSSQRLALMAATADAALAGGLPVYTGEIKIDWFRHWARERRPDAILVCGFGQVIDRPIIDLPPYGIYNFHPSDLAHRHGAGPAPHDELLRRGAATSCWSLHRLTEVVDSGPLVGQSPPVSVRGEADSRPPSSLAIQDKMTEPLRHLLVIFVTALIQEQRGGTTGALRDLDFEACLSAALKARFLAPIRQREVPDLISQPDPAIFEAVSKVLDRSDPR